MQLKTKSKIRILSVLMIILALYPMITANNNFLKNDSNNTSTEDRNQEPYSIPYRIEDLALSNIPAYLVWNFTTPLANIRNVAISSNGQYIAVGSYDWNLHFFENDNSTPLWSANVGETMEAVAISADGQYIVVGTYIMG